VRLRLFCVLIYSYYKKLHFLLLHHLFRCLVSDNSLTKENIRRNFRRYTCILYCNDEWSKGLDGGALRIYPNSLDIVKPMDAKKECKFVDINPINGRLLIFDSRLVHSVEEVTSNKRRIALTLWITRPEKNGVRGEIFDPGETI